uniref:Mos1 transposase HTH domain-containing protein n=1 Tax=Eptatretus burgeri TaxID=7764 RepID=A0A8C4NIW3_EPTBU
MGKRDTRVVVLYTLSRLSCRAMSREQRGNLKFLAKLSKTPSESFAMLQQVYGEEIMSRTCAFEWHRRFKEGREEVEDDPRSGKLSTSRTADNIERVKQMMHTDRRLAVRMIAEDLSINMDTVWSIITENLEMRKDGPQAVVRGPETGKSRCLSRHYRSPRGRSRPAWESPLLAMNRGYLNTIPRPNGRVVSGKVRHHQDQRKQGCRSRRPW